MPLLKRSRTSADSSRASFARPPTVPEPRHKGDNFRASQDFASLNDTVSVMDQDQPPKQTEPLVPPPRNQMRGSRGLESIEATKLSAPVDNLKRQSAMSIDPLDVYLSSEEDESESPDDSSLFADDLDDGSPVSSTYIFEETARIVSLVYAGKPQMIDISAPDRRRRHSAFDRRSFGLYRRSAHLDNLESMEPRPRKASLVSNFSDAYSYMPSTPLSSKSPSRTTTPASFLKSDPFSTERPPLRHKTATPRLTAAAGWREGIKGVGKGVVGKSIAGLGHMRRPSLPKVPGLELTEPKARPLSRNMTMPVMPSALSTSVTSDPAESSQTLPIMHHDPVPREPAQVSPQRHLRAKKSLSRLSRGRSLKVTL